MYDTFRDAIVDRHDNFVNQKYEDREGYVQLPYSFHLIATENIAIKYAQLVFNEEKLNSVVSDTKGIIWSDSPTSYSTYIKCVAIAHDCLEDARMTFGDLKKLLRKHFGGNGYFCDAVAMSCYRLMDEKGVCREGRKNKKYYDELLTDEVAMYIKLCDRLANVMYGKLMGGDMIDKYRKENHKFISQLYLSKFEPLIKEIKIQLS